ERTVTVTEQDTHCIRARVGHSEILVVIPIKVPNRYGVGEGADGETTCGLKGAIALAQQDTHRVRAGIGYRDVEVAVLVEVPRRDGEGIGVWKSKCNATLQHLKGGLMKTDRATRDLAAVRFPAKFEAPHSRPN